MPGPALPPPSIVYPQALYREGPGNRTMAINGLVISGPDPGAVPGASTKCPSEPHPRLGFGGHLWGRNRIDGRVKVGLSLGRVSARIGPFVHGPPLRQSP